MSTINHRTITRGRCAHRPAAIPDSEWARYAHHLARILDSAQRIADVCFWSAFTALIVSCGIEVGWEIRALLLAATLGFLAVASTLYDRR